MWTVVAGSEFIGFGCGSLTEDGGDGRQWIVVIDNGREVINDGWGCIVEAVW